MSAAAEEARTRAPLLCPEGKALIVPVGASALKNKRASSAAAGLNSRRSAHKTVEAHNKNQKRARFCCSCCGPEAGRGRAWQCAGMQLGGLELPRTKVHYVLSVTRLPFRHSCCSTSWIRTSADNRQRIYNPTPLATQSSCYSVLDYVRASVPAHALSLIFERSLLALIVPVGFAQK